LVEQANEGDGLTVGIVVALLCAVVTQLGFLCKHRGANHAPDVDMRRPLQSAGALFRSRWFAFGMAVAGGAFALHVVALSAAPLSLVQAVLSTGVVILAVLGNRIFGCRVTPRQWVGAGLTAAGLLLLVATLPASDSGAGFALPALIAFEAGMLALGTLLIAAPRLGAPSHHHGAVLGASAGTLMGVSDVAIKALTGESGLWAVLASPWLPIAVLAGALAFLASARGFQQGEAIPVIACTSTAANVTCIAGGIVVFGDALAGGVLLFVQIAAFALVAVASLVTPTGHAQPAVAAA
jgi:drug/metabolite transporter (DMT)-like permease